MPRLRPTACVTVIAGLLGLGAFGSARAPLAAARTVRLAATSAPRAATHAHRAGVVRHGRGRRRVRRARRRPHAAAPGGRAVATTSRRQPVTAPARSRGLVAPQLGGAAAAAAGAPSPLRFGVYPWAGVGAVDAADPALADRPYAALAAVKQLQGARSFVVHLYGEYSGADSGAADALLSDASWWSAQGVEVEAVLRYRPASAALAAGYVPWVGEVTARLATVPGVVAVQVGNEGNAIGSAAASDGAYPGAVAAIAAGLVTARAAVLATGRADIGIGFNWAAGASPCSTDPYFAALARAGGTAFASSVGWVGVDLYPGTWSAPAPAADPSLAAVANSVTTALACLRTLQMPSAGLSARVPITVAETGYPTDPTRSEASQAAVLGAIVTGIRSVAAAAGVTDLRWFGLRDANTGSGQLENGYGLLRDDYSPKPAFTVFAALVAADGR